MTCRRLIPIFASFAFLLPRALGAPAYVSPSDLRAEASPASADPFTFAPAGSVAPPPVKAAQLPAGAPQLTLRRPYIVAVEGDAPEGWTGMVVKPLAPDAVAGSVLRLPVSPVNPFLPAPDGEKPALPAVPAALAGDWYQPWLAEWDRGAWDAVQDAWQKDPAAVRRAFRTETKRDWPLTDSGIRGEAVRLSATKWVRSRWDGAVRGSVSAVKALGLRGPIIGRGPGDDPLSFLSATGAVNHPSPVLAPRVTEDAAVDRYGVGFLLRLTAGLADRILLPTLDLHALPKSDAKWVRPWVDEAVRNGIAGLILRLPTDADARAATLKAVEPLSRPNVYLPPPSEVGLLISRDTADLEPGAWVAAFHAYAALRADGVWPDILSDAQVAGGAPLARFSVLVVPAAMWCDPSVADALEDWARRGGTLVITDASAFSRAPDGRDTLAHSLALRGWKSAAPRPDSASGPDLGAVRVTLASGTRILAYFPDKSPALTERAVGDGRVLASVRPLETLPTKLWPDILRKARVPARPWREAVTVGNVLTITGRYARPSIPARTP